MIRPDNLQTPLGGGQGINTDIEMGFIDNMVGFFYKKVVPTRHWLGHIYKSFSLV